MRDERIGCYIVDFRFRKRPCCIDATVDDGCMARLVNHAKRGNVAPKIILIDSTPRFMFRTIKAIEVGTEQQWNYHEGPLQLYSYAQPSKTS